MHIESLELKFDQTNCLVAAKIHLKKEKFFYLKKYYQITVISRHTWHRNMAHRLRSGALREKRIYFRRKTDLLSLTAGKKTKTPN